MHFDGKAITLRSLDPNDPACVYSTVIDGFGSGSTLIFDSGEDANSVLDGLTLRGLGRSSISCAIKCRNSSPTIRNCVIKNSLAPWALGGGGINCYNGSSLIEDCMIYTNLGGVESGSGITLWGEQDPNSRPIVSNCVIKCNIAPYGGGIECDGVNAVIQNCAIVANDSNYPGHQGIYGNLGGAIFVSNSTVDIRNCIIWKNKAYAGPQLTVADISGTSSRVTVSYCNIQGGKHNVLVAPDLYDWYDGLPIDQNLAEQMLIWGPGNVDIDPLFALEPHDGGDGWFNNWTTEPDETLNNIYGDLHLKSQSGRFLCKDFDLADFNYDGIINLIDLALFVNHFLGSVHQPGYWPFNLQQDTAIDLKDLAVLIDRYLYERPTTQWVFDDITSPCIDAGDPNSPWTAELSPHGKRINMGAFGNTSQAGMSLSSAGNIANLDNDPLDSVDFLDLEQLIQKWLDENVLLSEDLNRDGIVSLPDYAVFAEQWTSTSSAP